MPPPNDLGSFENRMRQTLKRLDSFFPRLTPAPLKQFIIQSWSGELLQPWQFAHTTFDSIRISPAAILIDSRVYGNATHLHESIPLNAILCRRCQ
ncbi:MAG: hypothetical protein Ct9H300mP23_03100 [Nitrospinota bacterium]|nr:MAG: hypothetical protein Ct9H300mP23_03100 [Nitrospinota bacterium]